MAKILILGVGKTGTTILYQILKDSLPPDTICFFEPPTVRPATVPVPSQDVLAKVLLESPLGYAHYSLEVCAFYDKRIYLHRDPRDVLLSWFLYAPFHVSLTTDFRRFAEFASTLRAKEREPRSISLLDLLAIQARLAGPGIPPLLIVEEHLRNLGFAVRLSQMHGDGLFHLSYQDLVDRRLQALGEYLGLPLAATSDVGLEYRRVARSKTYGDWRNWFLPEDVEFFRPRLAEYMNEYGYGDDWILPENPQVPAASASEFLLRLAAHRGCFAGLNYSVDSFPPEINPLADPSLDQRAYMIPGFGSKGRTVAPCCGAEIRDPCLETLGGRAVNVLVQGEGYIFSYEVAFTGPCPRVDYWMVIRDRHGNGAVVDIRPAAGKHEQPSAAAHDASPTAGSRRRVRFEFVCRLEPGLYFVDAQVTTSEDGVARTFAHRIVDALVILVRQKPAL